MKTQLPQMSFRRIIGLPVLLSSLFMAMTCFPLKAKTIHTSTGGVSGSPLNWSNAGSWSTSGSGAPHVYVIRLNDYIVFDATNSAPYIDTMYILGSLEMLSNVTMTFNPSGAIQLSNNSASISGGSNNSHFAWNTTSAQVTGPFTSSRTVSNGPRYATAGTATSAAGDPQGSFVNGTLPISLLKLTVKSGVEGVDVRWSCVLQTQNATLELLVSLDAQEWKSIHSESLQGNLPEVLSGSFSWRNNEIPEFTGHEVYIKLKITEAGSTTQFSEIVHTAQSGGAIIPDAMVSAYPNPAYGVPVLSMANTGCGVVSVSIFNEIGSLCQHFELISEGSGEVISTSLVGLKTGIYRIQVQSTTTNNTITLIQQ